MSVLLCAVCSRKPRVEGSARCFECAPGKVAVQKPLLARPLSRLERAFLGLDPVDADDGEG